MLVNTKWPKFFLILLLIGLGVVASSLVCSAAAVPTVALSDADCIKCHAAPPRDVEMAGMAHKTQVTCQDCHAGHPPVTLEIIPACGQCHAGERHFDELKNCLECHVNPHRPLEIKLTNKITGPCLTCHDSQIEQLKEFPSYHTSLDCTGCHATTHGNVPDCVNCHRPHSEQMVQADCGRCHQAHKPLMVSYADDIPSANCGACHDDVAGTLQGSIAKHKELLCATCHQTNHGNVPDCANCHEPHAETMVQSDCLLCHQAHSPMPVAYGDDVASTNCAACHDDVYQALSTSQTKHEELLCATCHQTSHGNVPDCASCHDPHAASMTMADCTGCHQAHQPMPVEYPSDMASKNCGACHDDVLQTLNASTAKHRELTCATCHTQRHKMIPQCRDCHAQPHSESMLERFKGCGDCHQIAHDLVR